MYQQKLRDLMWCMWLLEVEVQIKLKLFCVNGVLQLVRARKMFCLLGQSLEQKNMWDYFLYCDVFCTAKTLCFISLWDSINNRYIQTHHEICARNHEIEVGGIIMKYGL